MPDADPIPILVVDDTPVDLLALHAVLDDGNYRWVEAQSGEQVLDILLEQHDFALILMAVQLPGMNGYDTVDMIKTRQQCASIPVIFLTANSQGAQRSYASGVVDYITKPYNPDLLRSKVHGFAEIYRVQQQLRKEIHKRRTAERQLRLASKVFEHSGEGMIITDQHAVIQAVNRAFEEISGYSREEAIGHKPSMLSSGRHTQDFYRDLWRTIEAQGAWEGEIYNRRKNGEIYPEWLKIVAIKDAAGKVTNYIGSFSDISSHTSAKQRLYHLAHYDNVTELPNRLLFNETLKRELINAKRRKSIVAVFFLDLDHFKNVNDTLGHAAGDVLLKEAALRLLQCKRDNDMVARMGGDEFTGMLVDLIHPEDAAIVAGRMLKELAEPFTLGDETVHVSGSIGLSIYPNDGQDVETLTRNADAAMYHAKELGRNNYQFYTEALHAESLRRMELEAQLRRAIKEEQFELYYQPQVETRTGRPIGMETLIRWSRPGGGMVSPAEFIPLAEETGLIVPIGAWVLKTACKQAKAWLDEGLPPLLLSVNLSSCQFREPDFMDLLTVVILESGYPPSQLQLELTERIIMHEDDFTVSRLKQISSTGIHLSIDDFGTGYSSMSYLKKFPINELKIDKSFIDEVCNDEDDGVIVSAMINLAHSLKLSVIAEGVEEAAQRNWLDWQGCDAIQGYYFSKPLSADDFADYIRKHTTTDD